MNYVFATKSSNFRFNLHDSYNANKHDIDCDQKSDKITPSEPVSNMRMNFAFEAKTSDFRFKLHKRYNANEHVSDCDKKSNKITPTEPASNIRMNFAFATKNSDSTYMKATMQMSMTKTVTRKAAPGKDLMVLP
jgi:hypothetical protein